MMWRGLQSLFILVALSVFPAQGATTTAAQLEEVTFEQKLGSQVPLDLQFRNADGKLVRFGDLLQDKPVLLSLVYYQCPMLCTLVLNGQVDAMKGVPFDLGEDYQAITVSFNHEETHVLAADKKNRFDPSTIRWPLHYTGEKKKDKCLYIMK